jgi:hypothetical protein
LTLLPLLTVFGHLIVTLARELWAPPAASATAARETAIRAATAPIARPRERDFEERCIFLPPRDEVRGRLPG